MHVTCNLRSIVKNEGVFKVIVSDFHFKSGRISGTELDRDTVTTGHSQDVIYGLHKSSNYFEVICRLQSFSNGKFCSCRICTDKHVTWSVCNSKGSCLRLAGKCISEITYFVLSGTLNHDHFINSQSLLISQNWKPYMA